MKKGNVSARKVACQGFALGCFVFIQLVGARGAGAESPRKVEGYELLGTLGYGIQFWDSDAFGVTVGADFGYTFPFGLRLGTDAGYAFGRTVESTNWKGEVSKTHPSSLTWGGSIGYDLLLSSFRLRGTADVGLLLGWTKAASHRGCTSVPRSRRVGSSAAPSLGLKAGR